MSKPVHRILSQWAGIGISAVLAAVGMVALRHALETPQPLKSLLPGEALLYRWRRRSIFYKVLGSIDAPPLVLLHTPDIGASAREMQYIMPSLAQSYRVYAPDLLGFGLSDRPGEEYSATMYSAFCQDFLRDVVQKPATLIASGLSCNYAISVAASVPDLCTSLVLISPIALQGHQRYSLGQFAERPLIKALLYPLLSTRLAFLLTHGYRQASQEDLAQFHANTHQLGAEHAAMALLAGKLTDNATRELEALQQPILMIWGTRALENHHTVASLHTAATLVDPARKARKVELIQGAGLLVHREQPEDVIAAIKHWQAQAACELPAQAETRTYTFRAVSQAPEQAAELEPLLTEPAHREAPPASAVLAYCVKCKQKREMLNAHEVTMKNGRPALRGICPVCGTSLNRIGGMH